ncbi:MAG: hypothetical protein WCY06_02940 [Flavobacteriaceae bacterium]
MKKQLIILVVFLTINGFAQDVKSPRIDTFTVSNILYGVDEQLKTGLQVYDVEEQKYIKMVKFDTYFTVSFYHPIDKVRYTLDVLYDKIEEADNCMMFDFKDVKGTFYVCNKPNNDNSIALLIFKGDNVEVFVYTNPVKVK